MWKEESNINITSSSLHHIEAKIKTEDLRNDWCFTGIYGWPEDQNKERTWTLLRDISRSQHNAWLCVGDWNQALFHFEKKRGVPSDFNRMNAFREAIAEYGLEDLGYKGSDFTWQNGQIGDGYIQERLDRCLANEKWRECFPDFQVEHMARIELDHCPIWISWRSNLSSKRFKCKNYRFEAMWLQDETCGHVV